ncbi:probable glutamate receptor [Patella vulgata]|uniref:probable glutamate receptor n=1 Tax=Patella vulgata TaxID=6465 RepID=UPI0024A8A92B|nr:probable glutamate receptor [Patella vulgata]
MFVDVSSSLPQDMMVVVVEFDTQPNILTALRNMDTTQNHNNFNVILMCSKYCVTSVLSQSDGYEMEFGSFTSFKHRSRWLIVMEEWKDSDFYKSSLDHITIVQHRQNVPHNPNTIQSYDRYSQYQFLTTHPLKNITPASQYLEKNLDLHQLMWRPGRQREFSKRSLNCLQWSEDDIFPNIKYALNGIHFRVGTKEWEPFVIKDSSGTGDGYKGLCVDILKVISAQLNFTYSLYFPTDNEWGRRINGEWTGLIRMLQKKEAEMVVAPIGISPEREQVMDFTFPYLFNQGVAMFRLRHLQDEKWLTLIKPLTWEVLLCIGVSLAGAAFIFHIIELINPFYLTSPNQSFCRRLEYLYGALVAHGSTNQPEAMAGRIFLSCWWIFCIILAASYSGTLVATLTVTKDKLPFDTLSEMVNQKEYTWGTFSQTLYVPLFSETDDQIFQQVWSGIVRENQTNPNILSGDADVQYDLVLNSKYVLLADSSIYDDWASRNCDIKKIKETDFSFDYSIGLQNNSAYTRQISHITLLVLESNLMDIWKRKWWRSEKCDSMTQTISTVIDIASLQSVFYFLLIGLFLAVVTLCFEMIYVSSKKIKT